MCLYAYICESVYDPATEDGTHNMFLVIIMQAQKTDRHTVKSLLKHRFPPVKKRINLFSIWVGDYLLVADTVRNVCARLSKAW